MTRASVHRFLTSFAHQLRPPPAATFTITPDNNSGEHINRGYDKSFYKSFYMLKYSTHPANWARSLVYIVPFTRMLLRTWQIAIAMCNYIRFSLPYIEHLSKRARLEKFFSFQHAMMSKRPGVDSLRLCAYLGTIGGSTTQWLPRGAPCHSGRCCSWSHHSHAMRNEYEIILNFLP